MIPMDLSTADLEEDSNLKVYIDSRDYCYYALFLRNIGHLVSCWFWPGKTRCTLSIHLLEQTVSERGITEHTKVAGTI